jgi:hypothetical protein
MTSVGEGTESLWRQGQHGGEREGGMGAWGGCIWPTVTALPATVCLPAGESLQIKLELLPEVSRAYVHLDYETTHVPEHKH